MRIINIEQVQRSFPLGRRVWIAVMGIGGEGSSPSEAIIMFYDV